MQWQHLCFKQIKFSLEVQANSVISVVRHLLDSSIQTKQQQSVKVLQLLVYTAAQTGAREFIEMVFSTSAGQIVFNSYKDRTPLPEDVAQANGHEELAQYLEDIRTRYTNFKTQSNKKRIKFIFFESLGPHQ